ncbi:MAG: hypothetical protein ACOYMN_21695 [Roseimicrobium sp.]
MKYQPIVRFGVLACTLMLACVSCESTAQPKKRKPIPPPGGDDISGLPFNRPRSFESGSGMGRMMPQTR